MIAVGVSRSSLLVYFVFFVVAIAGLRIITATRTLPARYPHATRTLPARYTHATRTLHARYTHATRTLGARYTHAWRTLTARSGEVGLRLACLECAGATE